MHGTRWHERTGNAAESLAKSTTSGSSSNMLFSIMFLGRLARSPTQQRKRNQTTDSKKSGNERVERVRTVAYINTHRLTQCVNIFYVLLCFLEFQRRVVANSHFSTQRPVIVTGWAGNLKPCSTKHWLSFFSFLLVNSYSTSWCFDLHKVKYTMLIRQFKKYSKEIDRNCCIYSQFVYLTTVPIKQIQ